MTRWIFVYGCDVARFPPTWIRHCGYPVGVFPANVVCFRKQRDDLMTDLSPVYWFLQIQKVERVWRTKFVLPVCVCVCSHRYVSIVCVLLSLEAARIRRSGHVLVTVDKFFNYYLICFKEKRLFKLWSPFSSNDVTQWRTVRWFLFRHLRGFDRRRVLLRLSFQYEDEEETSGFLCPKSPWPNQ